MHNPRKGSHIGFKFRMEIEGIKIAYVSEVSGLEIENESYEESSVNKLLHKFQKEAKYPPIVLKWGITQRDDLWHWYQDFIEGRGTKKNGAIILTDALGHDKQRWNFIQAYPVKWTGPGFKAESNTVAFETIELAHHGIKKG